MMETAGVYQDAVGLMVHLPSDGSRQPFVGVAPAGFVGQTTGLNAAGVAMGQDISLGLAFGSQLGCGSLLVVRHVLEFGTGLEQAVQLVRSLPRGASWMYGVSAEHPDPDYGPGIVLETFAHEPYYDGPSGLPRWVQWYLRDFVALLGGEDLPDNGVIVRGATWRYPPAFVGYGLPGSWHGQEWGEAANDWVCFPPQMEAWDDVVIASNHFVVPRARFTQFDPAIYLFAYGPPGALTDSVWRYESMVVDLRRVYGGIGFFGPDPEFPEEGSAGWLIDFLNTGRVSYYDGPEVEGHHAVVHNKARQLRALFGYMDDPWVGVDLGAFVNYFGGGGGKTGSRNDSIEGSPRVRWPVSSPARRLRSRLRSPRRIRR
jgi:hypothetical protein